MHLRALILCVLLVPVLARADGFVMTQSGLVLDSADHPVTAAAQSMSFRIFDSAAPSGTEVLAWQATCNVNVADGYYAVTLGGECGAALTPTVLPPSSPRWLEVSIGSVTLLPRLRIGTAITAALATSALDSEKLEGHPAAYFATAGHTHSAAGITDFAVAAADAVALAGVPWTSVSGVPSAFPPASHTHTTTDVTGLSAVATTGAYADLSGKPIGTVQQGKWCSGNGGLVTCTNDPPSGLAQASSGATAPATCSNATGGAFWYDTTTSQVKVCNGAAWVTLAAVTAPPAAPGAPTVSVANASLGISWTAVAGATSYEIGYAAGTSLGSTPTVIAVPTGTSATLSGLTNGTTYAVAVRTIASAYTSAWSAVSTAIPLAFWTCATAPSHAGCASSSQYTSCKAIKDDVTFAGTSGAYWIDTDGAGTNPPFQIWCDMVYDNGGWMLLASYRSGLYHASHNIASTQQMTAGGGTTPAAGWYPTTDTNFGHLPFALVNPSGKQVQLSCGTTANPTQSRYVSSTLFSTWAAGDHGTYGTSGSPGWGILNSFPDNKGRGNHYLCGAIAYGGHYGLGYCSGSGASGAWGNHLASYSGFSNGSEIGCAGTSNQMLLVWVK